MQEKEYIVDDSSSFKHDKYMQILLSNKMQLEQCQKSRGLKSCLQCESVLKCELRASYVDSVYSSMSKGQAGDFDFN